MRIEDFQIRRLLVPGDESADETVSLSPPAGALQILHSVYGMRNVMAYFDVSIPGTCNHSIGTALMRL